jgi:hypothetical protein
LRVHGDVEHAAVLSFPHLGRTLHGIGHELAVLDDPQPAGPLGHEQAAVGQKGQAPRRFESGRDDLNPKCLFLGLDDLIGRVCGRLLRSRRLANRRTERADQEYSRDQHRSLPP